MLEFQFRKSFQILEIFGQFSQPITQRDLLTLVDNGWTFEESNRLALVKDFTFNDFNETFGIMTRIAIYADGICHHPEWFNVYNNLKVSVSRIFKLTNILLVPTESNPILLYFEKVTLATHDIDGISDLDFDLANFIDSLTS